MSAGSERRPNIGGLIQDGVAGLRERGQTDELVAIVHPDDAIIDSVSGGVEFIEAQAVAHGDCIPILQRANHPRGRVTVMSKADFERGEREAER